MFHARTRELRCKIHLLCVCMCLIVCLCSFKLAPGLVFSDQFLQMSTYLPSANVYGLGEHADRLRLNTNHSTYTLFASDIGTNPDVRNPRHTHTHTYHTHTHTCRTLQGTCMEFTHSTYVLRLLAIRTECSCSTAMPWVKLVIKPH